MSEVYSLIAASAVAIIVQQGATHAATSLLLRSMKCFIVQNCQCVKFDVVLVAYYDAIFKAP